MSYSPAEAAYAWRCAAWVYGAHEARAVEAVCDFLVWGNT